MLIELIGRGFSNRFFRRLFMLIDFSLFRRCGPGRNDADRFFLAHHMHNKEQSRALGVSIAPSRASSSAVASTRRKNGSKKTSQASWKFTLCLRRLMAAFSESHTKVCPRRSSPVSTNYSVYTLHVCVKRLTYSCARRGTCDGADIGGLGSAVSAARLHSRRVEGAPRQKCVLLSSSLLALILSKRQRPDAYPEGRKDLSKLVNLRAVQKPISDARTATYVILSIGSGPGGRRFESFRPDHYFSIQYFTLRFQLQVLLLFYGQYGQHRRCWAEV